MRERRRLWAGYFFKGPLVQIVHNST
jgi:hypothetical protein